MVRSLKVIGASLAAYVIGSTSALTFTPASSIRQSPFGVNSLCYEADVVRLAPLSSFERSSTAVFASAGPAILDRPAVEKKQEKAPVKEKRTTGNESWEVRIYNDGTNTREHVARCLVRVTGLSEVAAYNTMMQAHQFGIAVVGRWVFERAEMYYEALKTSGIVCDLNPVDEDL